MAHTTVPILNYLAWRKRVIDGNRVMAMKRPASVALMAASPKVKAAATPLVCAMCAATTDDHDAVHTHDRVRWVDHFKVSKPRDGGIGFSTQGLHVLRVLASQDDLRTRHADSIGCENHGLPQDAQGIRWSSRSVHRDESILDGRDRVRSRVGASSDRQRQRHFL